MNNSPSSRSSVQAAGFRPEENSNTEIAKITKSAHELSSSRAGLASGRWVLATGEISHRARKDHKEGPRIKFPSSRSCIQAAGFRPEENSNTEIAKITKRDNEYRRVDRSFS